jgi:raffinose/stachyose/melibiose transport system permease protein
VSGKIFSIFYSPYSGLGSIFEKLGIKALAGFAPLGNEKQALYAAAFVDNWHWWGFVLVLMLSALHQVDTSLYEVAKTEGANAWQTLIHVTIPQIKPTIISYFVFVIIAAFTTFDYVWIMTQGGPAGSTEVFATRIYKTTFINYDAGYGAAMSLSVCILALSVYFVLKFIQKRGRE